MFALPRARRKGVLVRCRIAEYHPAMSLPVRSEVDLRARHTVETPEHVPLAWEVAGLGSRSLAAIVDHALIIAGALAINQLTEVFQLLSQRWAEAAGLVVAFVLAQGYFIGFEALWHGQTPGKRLVGIRVVRTTGHAAGLAAIVVRNLVRLADFLVPPPYLTGMVLLFLHPRAQRLGDLAAGTLVVRERLFALPPAAVAAPAARAGMAARLTADEFQLLEALRERAPTMDPDARLRLATQLLDRIAPRFPDRTAEPLEFLDRLYQTERSARAAGSGGTASERTAHRLLARQEPRWTAFDGLARRASTRGLDSFAPDELPDYAARYREVAADLARARTYGAPAPVLGRLERLAAAGHNTLYRDTGRDLSRIWQWVFGVAPAGVVAQWRVVLLAFLTFAAPAAGGYLLLRQQPALATEVLPDVVLERAAAGAERTRQGRGYFEAEAGERPVLASAIMTNNMRVALNCFAGGIFAGVGSLVLLAYNGLAIGAVSAHFDNLAQLGYLWTFVIGHGVLELFAIWVAGAAGFLLGWATIAPGDLSRGEALQRAGRAALPMVTAVIVLLTFAGLIEGLISASTLSLAWRLGVSATSLLLLLLYLLNGWGYLRRSGTLAGPE